MIIKREKQKKINITKTSTDTDVVQQDADTNVVVEQDTKNTQNTQKEDQNIETNGKEQEIDLFNIENIDFAQRQERRRGSRRRGYRRIDDRNLVSRAKEEAENIKKSAFEEGFKTGIEKAAEDIVNLRNELSNFMNARKEVFEYIAPDILEISVEIAKKIIKKELETDPQALINTITDVLKNLSKGEPKITVKVKPQAVQYIKDTLPNITYQYGIDSKINIVADPSIEDGGCVLQTNNGIVDASINTQLEIIRKTLAGM